MSQVKTVLTICDLGKIVSPADYEELLHRYEREDGMFCFLVGKRIWGFPKIRGTIFGGSL